MDSESGNSEGSTFLIVAAGIAGDPQEEVAGFAFEAVVGRPEGEILLMEGEADFSRFAGEKIDFLKAFQFFHRARRRSCDVV